FVLCRRQLAHFLQQPHVRGVVIVFAHPATVHQDVVRRSAAMSALAIYTAVHVIISLIGIVSGLVVAAGLLSSKRLDQWTQLFLSTTALTSITGFGFP